MKAVQRNKDCGCIPMVSNLVMLFSISTITRIATSQGAYIILQCLGRLNIHHNKDCDLTDFAGLKICFRLNIHHNKDCDLFVLS